MAAQPVQQPVLPTVPPDKPNPMSLAPKPNSPAKTAGGARGEESTSENTKVSDTETIAGGNPEYRSEFGRRLSDSSKLNQENLENLEKVANKNTRIHKGASSRLRANSIGNADTLESIRRTQKLQYKELVGAINTVIASVNSISTGLFEWFTEQETQTKFLNGQVRI
jgi:hypothetical protein